MREFRDRSRGRAYFLAGLTACLLGVALVLVAGLQKKAG
jgi:hypothetical protein